MDIEQIKQAIVTKVYHIPAEKKVPLHKHPKHDEVFYCVKGSGFGVLADREVLLSVGQTFIVPANTMHALRTEGSLYVASFMVPVLEEPPTA
jgi:mannose-6-phosphate isomerase-like protein (cupin superfamily)